MNLRTLKKLSKRAAPYLAKMGDRREQFVARKKDNYTGLIINARKHCERWRMRYELTPHEQATFEADGNKFLRTRDGGFVRLTQPYPRKGTVMVGGMDGGESPEWDEETAYEALYKIVHCHFTDWEAAAEHDRTPICTADLSTPSKVFYYADVMLWDIAAEKAAALYKHRQVSRRFFEAKLKEHPQTRLQERMQASGG